MFGLVSVIAIVGVIYFSRKDKKKKCTKAYKTHDWQD